MTIKLTLNIEPVHETASVKIEQRRDGETIFQHEFVAPVAPTTSPTVQLEVGDKLRLEVEAAHRIVYNKDQFAVQVEDLTEEKAARMKAHEAAKKPASRAAHNREDR